MAEQLEGGVDDTCVTLGCEGKPAEASAWVSEEGQWARYCRECGEVLERGGETVRFDAPPTQPREETSGRVDLRLPRGPLELRLCEQAVCIRDTPCDGCNCAAFPSYPALVFDLRHQRNFWAWKHSRRLSELREFAQQRDDLLAWLEEVATGAEHVAEKLKREADDFEDRAYYEDAERFTVQATAYQAVIQRLKKEGG